MEQCATGHPPRSLARKEQTLPPKGKGFCTSLKPHYIQLVTTAMSLGLLPISSAPAQVSGRLKYFHANKKLITDDPWVLETIMGYKIEFHTVPHQVTWPRTFMSIAQQESVQVEVDKMFLQGAIHPGGVCQQHISGPQKRRRSSPCCQFKESEFLSGFPTFQNGGNPHVKGPSKKRRFYGKIGPQRRILYCPSLVRASKVLKVPMEGKSMGICVSPLRAGQCSQNIHKNHETCGGNSAELRDSTDYISKRSSNHSRLGADCQTPTGDCENLGFVINLKKSVLSPVQKIEFLGMTVDSLTVCLALSRDKVRSIRREYECFIANPTTTVRQISTSPRSFELFHSSSVPFPTVLPLPATGKDTGAPIGRPLRAPVVLNQEAIEELQWWAENLMAWNGRALAQPDPSIIIESDTSREGLGAQCNGLSAGCLWSQSEQFLHINCLELLAGSFAIKCLAKEKTNIHIQLFMDNVTALTFFNKMGGTKYRVLASLSHDLWQWCLQWQITVSTTHILGILNVNADRESRSHLDSSDWKLCPAVFQALQNKWGPIDIDLFASRLTNQLTRFVSWKPDPLSEAVDAFSLQWNNAF